MRRSWLCVVAIVVVAACDGASPQSVPAPATSPTPPAPPPQYALSGVVRVGGQPVAGATVALLTFETGALIASTTTGGNGLYRLSDVRNVSPFSGALVSVTRPESFTETRYIWMSQDQQVDFDLEPATFVRVGQVIQSAVGDADRCASLGYGGRGGAVCRRIALTVPGAGTLEITVTSAPLSPFDGTLLKPDGTIGVYASAAVSPLHLTLPVAAELTYQIDVVHISSATREFELNTVLR